MLYRQTKKSDIRDILFQLALIFAQITMGPICPRFGRYNVGCVGSSYYQTHDTSWNFHNISCLLKKKD